MGIDEQYNPSEEDTFRKTLFDRMDSQHNILITIREQTIKTNGRVNKLEWWRNAIIYVFGIAILLAVPIISLIKSEIRSTVVGVLSDYNISVQK